VFDRSLYLRAAKDLRRNEGQWKAYNSEGHCAVLAGPGSGKTKTLTIKLARMLAEDVNPPRGAACITYNNECARELEGRLLNLGVEPSKRVFIGTVHSFALTQILIPYAKTAHLGLPDGFKVATQYQKRAALETAYQAVIGGPGNPENSRFLMELHRRSVLDRTSARWTGSDRTPLAERYEAELRNQGVIDFDDMPLLGWRALRENEWICRALVAKYPILAVDEYQDLGVALHQMVMKLCFEVGIRLFAVGDVDQSIYGFIGAHPELLQQVADRDDLEDIPLKLNYRCGSRIVAASEIALGEDRGYETPEDAAEGLIFFHPVYGNYQAQAEHLFDTVLPAIQGRNPGLPLGSIAILYSAAFIGDDVASAAQARGLGFIRSDTNALYPRSNRLMRWLEQCAIWCCDGWKSGTPRFSSVAREGIRLFPEALVSDETRRLFQRTLLNSLWSRRDSALAVHDWLQDVRDDLVGDLIAQTRTSDEDLEVLDDFIERTSPTGDISDMTLGLFSGFGEGNDRLCLSTLHSAKGREFAAVILFGMEEGRLPRGANPSPAEVQGARRLFYVGFTRAEKEVHLIFNAGRPSRFVQEIQHRLEEQQDGE
jgi:DNA helicase-2/ATP-dependent DNA helicase PcrA